MANANVVIKFTPTPVPAGATYSLLRVVLTDSAGTAQTAEVPASTAPTVGPDGSPEYMVAFTGAADGAATVVVTAIAADGSTLGASANGSGTLVTAMFPQATTIAVS